MLENQISIKISSRLNSPRPMKSPLNRQITIKESSLEERKRIKAKPVK